MKKWIIALLLLIGISYGINVIMLKQYKKENALLLENSIKNERLIIQLNREAFQNFPYKKHGHWGYIKLFDSFKNCIDTIINNYPELDTLNHVNFIRFYKKMMVTSDTINLYKLIKTSNSKQKFELTLLNYLNNIGKEIFHRPTSIDMNPLMLMSEGSTTPIGGPIKIYLGLWGYGMLDLSKNLVTNIPIKLDSMENQIAYLPADKLGTFVFEGYYNYSYLGEKHKFYFEPLEYTVTEPLIQTTILDKNYLNINEDNHLSFDFGKYKKSEIKITVDGAYFKNLEDNVYNIHPNSKRVKITFMLVKDYGTKNLGTKVYEAK